MSKSKWRYCQCFMLLVCSLFLASCGSGDSDKKPNPEPNPPEEQPKPQAEITSVSTGFVGTAIVVSAKNSQGIGLTYSWVLATPNGSLTQLSNTNKSSVSFTPDRAGNYTVAVTITDNTARTSTATHTVKVAKKDTPVTPEPPITPEAPTPEAPEKPQATITAATAALVGTTVAASAEDSQGKDLTYLWELTIPSGSKSQLSSTDTVSVNFTPDIAGSYPLKLTITDKAGHTSSTLHTISVTTTDKGIPLSIKSTISKAQSNVPFTFAQPFAAGEFKTSDKFSLRDTATDQLVPLQTNSKATHTNGSLRHAIFSGVLSSLNANEKRNFELVDVDPNIASTTYALSDVLASNLNAAVELKVDGKNYSMALKDLFKSQPEKLWLDGQIVREWMAAANFKDSSGQEHPHLAGRINLRVYGKQQHVLVDTLVENNWTYQAKPRNFTYDVKVKINGKVVFAKDQLNHLHRSRWHKRFWVDEAPQLHIAHDTNYLIKSKAIPHYDPNLVGNIDKKLTDRYAKYWVDEDVTLTRNYGSENFDFTYNKIGPMGIGMAERYMGTTGGRPDIGPLPRWHAAYVLNQDEVSKKVALGMGDLAGSWPIHYKDKNTGKFVSLDDYPYISSIWNTGVTLNPATGKKEAPTACDEANNALCVAPYKPDTAHQPSMTYVPYLVTGDYYYLDELHYWANYNFIKMNSHWRESVKGLFAGSHQDRGQAWAMRTLGNAASITPDSHPAKTYFTSRLKYNIDDYLDRYVTNSPNGYGAMKPNYSYPTASPWMDDFFTWSLGYVYDLGYKDVKPVYKWKSKFPVQRLGYGTNNPNDYCWNMAAAYHLKIAPAKGEPMFQTIKEVYDTWYGPKFGKMVCNSQEMATALKTEVGAIPGWEHTPAGYPSNLQPAIAVAADSGTRDGQKAWKRFINRSIKPDYRGYPNWAIVPRSTK